MFLTEIEASPRGWLLSIYKNGLKSEDIVGCQFWRSYSDVEKVIRAVKARNIKEILGILKK